MNRKPTARVDIYADVTDRIIAALESGPEPWAKFWESSADTWRPVNHGTDRPYRGVNLLLLAAICHRRGLAHNRWLTFNQARELGGSVRKGSKGVSVVLWRPIGEQPSEANAEKGQGEHSDESRAVVLRQFYVFNVADCDGLAENMHDAPVDDSLASQIVHKSGAQIIPGEPCYRPADDLVQLPLVSAFDSPASFYAAAFHELAHWSGKRVGRERKTQRFGDDAYAVEELVAELTSAMLCGVCGFTAVARSAGYFDHWLHVLRADKRAIFTVAAAAQCAADFLLAPTADAQASNAA